MKKERLILSLILSLAVAAGIFGFFSRKTLVTDHPASDRPVLLELGSNSCASCKAMHAVLDEFERKYRNEIVVTRIDVFQDKSAMEKFALRAIPTQVIQDLTGRELFRHEGFISLTDLESQALRLDVIKDRNAH